jgi:hypothetical protein
MLRPKVQEILNEKFRDHSNAQFLLFLEGYISAFWDHNLETRIGFQGLGWSGMRWAGNGGRTKCCPPHAWEERPCLPRPAPAVCRTPPPHVRAFARVIFPLIPFLGGVVVGCSHHRVWLVLWMCARPSLWIALAMAGVTAAPKGQHPCAHVCLVVFPPPLVGAGLGRECVVWPVFCGHPAADLKLLWTEGHDKLGVGVTQESRKVPRYEFSMRGQGPSKHREC